MKLKRYGLFLIIMALVLVCQACSAPSSESSSDADKAKIAQESPAGAVPIPITVTVPDGIRVVEKAALWAPMKDEPELHTVYAGLVLESSQAVLGFNMDYQIWREGDKEQASEYKTNDRLWFPIPAEQSGARLIKMGDYPAWMKPENIEIQLKPGDYYADRQKDLDLLNSTAFPNPYFTVNSAEMVATQDAASGLFNIEAKGKVTNNLPVEAGVSGLFVFYNSNGEVIGLTTTLCSDSKSYACGGTLPIKIPAQSEGELTTVLPYPLVSEPARVALYPFVDVAFAGYLNQIK